MNHLVDTIIARRGTRPIRVERRRRRWSRGDVHAIGTAAVEGALCRMGGAMDGEARARLLGIRPSGAVEKRDIGCAVLSATEPENQADLSTGALLGDVRRLFAQSPGRCPPELYEARTR